MISRRHLLAGGAATLAAWPLLARTEEAGFQFDWQGAAVDAEIAARLDRQIAMVRALPIDPEVIAFWSVQPLFVQPPGGPSREGPRGVFITRDPFPDDNPVLLHELCHRFHRLRLPQGAQNPDVLGFFAQAKALTRYRADAYLYTNAFEFFAMTASVALHGRAARPPFTRAELQRDMPEYVRWIDATFRYRG